MEYHTKLILHFVIAVYVVLTLIGVIMYYGLKEIKNTLKEISENLKTQK